MADFGARLTQLSNCVEDLQDDLIAFELPHLPTDLPVLVDPKQWASGSDTEHSTSQRKIRDVFQAHTRLCERELVRLQAHTAAISLLELTEEENGMPIVQEILGYSRRIAVWQSALRGHVQKLGQADTWSNAVAAVEEAVEFVQEAYEKDQRQGSSDDATGLSLTRAARRRFLSLSNHLKATTVSCESAQATFEAGLAPMHGEDSRAAAPGQVSEINSDHAASCEHIEDWQGAFRQLLRPGLLGTASFRACRRAHDLAVVLGAHETTRTAAIEAIEAAGDAAIDCLLSFACESSAALPRTVNAENGPGEGLFVPEESDDNPLAAIGHQLRATSEDVARRRHNRTSREQIENDNQVKGVNCAGQIEWPMHDDDIDIVDDDVLVEASKHVNAMVQRARHLDFRTVDTHPIMRAAAAVAARYAKPWARAAHALCNAVDRSNIRVRFESCSQRETIHGLKSGQTTVVGATPGDVSLGVSTPQQLTQSQHQEDQSLDSESGAEFDDFESDHWDTETRRCFKESDRGSQSSPIPAQYTTENAECDAAADFDVGCRPIEKQVGEFGALHSPITETSGRVGSVDSGDSHLNGTGTFDLNIAMQETQDAMDAEGQPKTKRVAALTGEGDDSVDFSYRHQLSLLNQGLGLTDSEDSDEMGPGSGSGSAMEISFVAGFGDSGSPSSGRDFVGDSFIAEPANSKVVDLAAIQGSQRHATSADFSPPAPPSDSGDYDPDEDTSYQKLPKTNAQLNDGEHEALFVSQDQETTPTGSLDGQIAFRNSSTWPEESTVRPVSEALAATIPVRQASLQNSFEDARRSGSDEHPDQQSTENPPPTPHRVPQFMPESLNECFSMPNIAALQAALADFHHTFFISSTSIVSCQKDAVLSSLFSYSGEEDEHEGTIARAGTDSSVDSDNPINCEHPPRWAPEVVFPAISKTVQTLEMFAQHRLTQLQKGMSLMRKVQDSEMELQAQLQEAHVSGRTDELRKCLERCQPLFELWKMAAKRERELSNLPVAATERVGSTSSPSVSASLVDAKKHLVNESSSLDGAANREEAQTGPPNINREDWAAIFDVNGIALSSSVLTNRALLFLHRREAELAYEQKQRSRWDELISLLDLVSRTLEAFEQHAMRDTSPHGKRQQTARHLSLLPTSERDVIDDESPQETKHGVPAHLLGDAPWVHNFAGAVQATVDIAKHREAVQQLAAAELFQADHGLSKRPEAARSEKAVMVDTVQAETIVHGTDVEGISGSAHLASLCDQLLHALQSRLNDENRQEEHLCRLSQDGAVLESVDVLALVRLARIVLTSAEAAMRELGTEIPFDRSLDANLTENAKVLKPRASSIEDHYAGQQRHANENAPSSLVPPGLAIQLPKGRPDDLPAWDSSLSDSGSNIVSHPDGYVHVRSSPRSALDELPLAANSVSEHFLGNFDADLKNTQVMHGMDSKVQATPSKPSVQTITSTAQLHGGDAMETEWELDSKFCARACTHGCRLACEKYGVGSLASLLARCRQGITLLDDEALLLAELESVAHTHANTEGNMTVDFHWGDLMPGKGTVADLLLSQKSAACAAEERATSARVYTANRLAQLEKRIVTVDRFIDSASDKLCMLVDLSRRALNDFCQGIDARCREE
eukprot:INCI16377.4.p1 GENE.INCI16377.4~~INCI16377.4.p1  ORF type:complete len:1621 (-),score=313.72 INCI16377.4:2481-7343(-)